MLKQVEPRWDRWASSPKGRRQLSRWSHQHPHLQTWSLEELRHPVSSARTDAMQASLIEIAQRGDPEAATTLLLQLRPGLYRLVGWLAAGFGRGRTRAEVEDDVVGVFCEVVMRHPFARRRRRIAANLLLDTRQQLWRSGMRNLRVLEATDSAERASACTEARSVSPEEVAGELDIVDTLATAISSLPGTEASRRLTGEVAYRAWILDEANSAIAAETGLRPDAVRARLSRLRSHVDRTRQRTHVWAHG